MNRIEGAELARIMPHRAEMLLLQAVTGHGGTWLEAEALPQASALLYDARGQVPSWVGIEYIAQAVCALAGIHSREQGLEPQLGFLLGTRKYSASVRHFEGPLHIRVDQKMRDEGNLVLFEGVISQAGSAVASAEIKAIQPEDAQSILAHLSD